MELLRRLREQRLPTWLGPLFALFATYALFAALSPETFTTTGTLVLMTRQTVVVGLCAAGMTLIILMGGIDLGVGSAVALGTVVLALLTRAGHGPLAASVATVLVTMGIGALVGTLITRFQVTPFIVTLGSMSVMRGVAKGLADEQKIDADAAAFDWLVLPPPELAWMVLPPAVWILLVVCAVTGIVLSSTRFGRHVVAVGSNELAARVCGIQVSRIKVCVYALGGLATGLAAIIEFATLTLGDPTDAVGLELDVIAAVVIGGGSLSGGQGSVAGSLIGALLMTVIKTGCTHLGLPNWVQEIITGGIIVFAALVDRLRYRQGR